jgi:2-alkyl-3-oxoalkanoate reductase
VKALVTGGSGFLGRALIEELLRRGHAVASISRTRSGELEALGCRSVAADLGDAANNQLVRQALQGVDVVFHTAAKTGVWGPAREFERANVAGTRNLLAQCEAAKVRRLVFTGSPSVAFDGRDHVRAGNDLPYARRPGCAYSRTKAIAERDVLGANGRWGLATCSLRPHLILGPRDPHLVPRLVERARAGKLAIIGRGDNEVTLCAVENAVHAHLLAAESLGPSAPHAGRAFFIGQEQSVLLWPWIQGLLERLGIPPIRRRIALGPALGLGASCELLWRLSRARGEPPLTRFVALQLARSHSYDMLPAREAFGYTEQVSLEQATDAIVAALEPRAAPRAAR